MKTRLFGIKTLGSIVAAAIVATIPLMGQASDSKTTSVTPKTTDSAEVASLKRQVAACRGHRRHHRRACAVTQTIEKRVVIEKPVIIEKIVEKQVFVDRPAVIEKAVVVETPVQMEQRVTIEHSKHRTHLLHLGIPFIGVTLF